MVHSDIGESILNSSKPMTEAKGFQTGSMEIGKSLLSPKEAGKSSGSDALLDSESLAVNSVDEIGPDSVAIIFGPSSLVPVPARGMPVT